MLSARNLSFAVPVGKEKRSIVDIPEIRVEDNTVHFIMGPNGSGKSTLLKLLLGVYTAPKTEIVVNAVRFGFFTRRKILSSIGCMSGKRASLNANIPVINSLLVNAALYGTSEKKARERIDTLAPILGLSEKIDTQAKRLSFGERVKFDIMSPVLHEPSLLMLDEPSVGMDEPSKKELAAFFRSYAQQGKNTVLCATHDFDLVRAIPESCIYILNHGKLCYDGKAETLIREADETTKFIVETTKGRIERDTKGSACAAAFLRELAAESDIVSVKTEKTVRFNDIVVALYGDER